MTIALACTVAFAVPAASGIAGNGIGKGKTKNLAKKECNAEKKALKQELGKQAGKGVFRTMHGKHAMRNCKRDAKSEINDDAKNAAQECRALSDEELQEFGTNEPNEKSKGAKKNAFGKCVSFKVREEVNGEIEDFKNAAKECKSLMEDSGDFEELWGAKRNAFGKCVSATAKQADENEE